MSELSPLCAAVDWGTSSFRLWLLAADGSVLAERRSGQGLLSVDGRFTEVLEDQLRDAAADASLPVVICGMAGAKTGWREAAYLDAPCAVSDVPAAAVRVEGIARDVRILPGVAQRDADAPDVMRGEETQLLGIGGDGQICMPGTHSKWVTLRGGRIERFSTWMTGELFALLSSRSILAGDTAGEADPNEAFRAALNETLDSPERISNALFGLRAGALVGAQSGGASALSGHLIGLELVGVGVAGDVTLLASGRLGDLYAAALDEIGVPVTRVDATQATQAGLHRAAQEIWTTEAV